MKKFRYWSESKRKYVTTEEMPIINEDVTNHLTLEGWDNDCFEQYIGIKDDDGFEIYEGDIVMGYFDVDKISDAIYLNLTEEELSNCSKQFVVHNMRFGYSSPVPDKLKIIGNIHKQN